MTKNIASRDLAAVLQGSSFALFCAEKDKMYFEKYKNGTLEDIVEKKGTLEVKKEDILPSMQTLELLEKLGYPMEELGTYLYKELIVEVYKEIKELGGREDEEKYQDIISSLKDAFSSFYRFLAIDYLEIGNKAFHLYIQKAILLIDHDKEDEQLLRKIFGEKPSDIDYGLQAFQFAAFLGGKYSYDYDEEKAEYTAPKIKKLSNMPEDLKLKIEFKVEG